MERKGKERVGPAESPDTRGTYATGRSPLLTVAEFACALNVTVACVRRWIIERRVDIVKLGRLVRIPMAEVDRLISEGRRPAAQQRR